MQPENISLALGDAAQDVLENMFFVVPEDRDDAGASIAPPEVHAHLEFSGEWHGFFELQTAAESARALAEGFLGSFDGSEIEEDKTAEVVCELANMICGATLTRLASDKIFNLGSPAIVPTRSSKPASGTSDATASRTFDLGFGAILFTLSIGMS